MHFQRAPHAEAKLVRCTRGAIYDVIVDLRPDSATYRRWVGVELTADEPAGALRPRGLRARLPDARRRHRGVLPVSECYTPDAEGGVRWDDPAFGIDWPTRTTRLSPKDASWPDYSGRMIIVDTALERARAGRQADPRRPWSAPASWAAGSRSRSRRRRRAWSSSRSRTAHRRRGARGLRAGGRRGRRARSTSREELEQAIAAGRPAITDDAAAARRRPRGSTRSSRSRARSSSARSVALRGDRARQARGPDERGARRHGRPDPEEPTPTAPASSTRTPTATSPACR